MGRETKAAGALLRHGWPSKTKPAAMLRWRRESRCCPRCLALTEEESGMRTPLPTHRDGEERTAGRKTERETSLRCRREASPRATAAAHYREERRSPETMNASRLRSRHRRRKLTISACYSRWEPGRRGTSPCYLVDLHLSPSNEKKAKASVHLHIAGNREEVLPLFCYTGAAADQQARDGGG